MILFDQIIISSKLLVYIGYRCLKKKLRKMGWHLSLKSILVIVLCLHKMVKGRNSFIVSLQTDIEGPFAAKANSWIEYYKHISSAKEFTACHWLKIKFHNLNIAGCVWAHCTVQNDGDNMKCTQVCLQGIYKSANRN